MTDLLAVKAEHGNTLLHKLQEAGWSGGADIWARADFKCEYCDLDLMKNYELWEQGEEDHILPRKSYSQLEFEKTNLASVCCPCQKVKGFWDPNMDGDPIYRRPAGALPTDWALTSAEREKLVARCRERIRPRRMERVELYRQCKEIIDTHPRASL